MTEATNASYQQLPGQREEIKILPANKTKKQDDQTSGIAGTFDQFLTLLTTQLQNQDPLSPMESNEFTNQLVAFASVEQSINSNMKLDSLIELQAGQQAIDAVSLIGKEVQAVSRQGVVKDGKIKWQYNLPQDVAEIEIQIQDDSGNVVARANSRNPGSDYINQLDKHRGPHIFEWDGLSLSQEQAKDGDVYSLVVKATGADGKPVEVSSDTFGRVSGLTTVGERTRLIIDGKISAGLDTLVSVKTQEGSTPETDRNAIPDQAAATDKDATSHQQDSSSHTDQEAGDNQPQANQADGSSTQAPKHNQDDGNV